MANLAMLFVLTLAVPVAAINLRAAGELSLDMEAGATGVGKVVNLLKDMQKTLEKEAEEDEVIYEKMVCWCNTNDKEKTKSIKEAEARIESLTTSIEEGTGASSRLNTEIANLEKEVAANQAALDKAAAMRTKELAEFNAEEKDVLQSIASLKAAITVLSKHQLLQMKKGKTALLQIDTVESSKQLGMVRTVLQHEMEKHAADLEGVLTPSQKRKASAFSQDQSHAPSSEIFGIMQAMKESFESNLAGSRKDEATGVSDFTALKASKEEEIAAGQDQINSKTQELAATDEKLAQDKMDLDDTTASLSADEKFLMNLKETCSMTDSEYEQRVKERMLEIEAVGKALEILTSDDAHDLFSKTMSLTQDTPALVQMKKAQRSQRRNAASKLLAEVAKKTQNPRLSALAVRIRLDAFVKVKKAIDDMIAELMKQKKDEIAHRDYCIENLNKNEAVTERKDREKKDILTKIDDLTATIETLIKEIETLKSEISEMGLQLKHAGEDRGLENKEFATFVADQRATQKLLKSALDVLKSVYLQTSLVQKQANSQPAGFKKKEKNAHGGGVVGMIQGLIDESKTMEADALHAEENAQKAYEDFVKDTNLSIEEKSKEQINKSELKATAEDDKVKSEESRDNILLELEQLSNENADLHKACDFVLKNFDIRQTARDEEVEALKQAKAILSGAKFMQVLKEGFMG
jgi:chromosome segregation ATPase